MNWFTRLFRRKPEPVAGEFTYGAPRRKTDLSDQIEAFNAQADRSRATANLSASIDRLHDRRATPIQTYDLGDPGDLL